MTDEDAQLQDDVTGLGGQAPRMRREMEPLNGRPAQATPDPLSGGH
jgi:hypothetical protein